MAILTRRGLTDLLDEAPVERKLLNRPFISRLNRLDDQSLATEWELIILSALSRVGLVECEPDLGGSSNLDLRLAATSGLRFIADVTYLSDDEAIRANPIRSLADEIQRRMLKHGITGNIQISKVSAHIGESGKISLLIPLPHEFKKYIVDKTFTDFLTRIVAAPYKRTRTPSITTEDVGFTPSGRRNGIGFVPQGLSCVYALSTRPATCIWVASSSSKAEFLVGKI